MHVRPPSQPEALATSRTAAPQDRAFDRWLHDRLNLLYDDVLREPLPPCLREVLDQVSR